MSPVSSWAWSVTPPLPMGPSIPTLQTPGSLPLCDPHFPTSVVCPQSLSEAGLDHTRPHAQASLQIRPPDPWLLVRRAAGLAPCCRPGRCAVGCFGKSRAHEPSRVTHHFLLYPFIRASPQPGATVQADGHAGSGSLKPGSPSLQGPLRPAVCGAGSPSPGPGCSPLGPGSCGS